MKLKTILLPTDFSANSLNAIKFAISVFHSKNTRFVLLNAYRITPISIEEYVDKIPDFAKESEKGLQKMLTVIKKTFPGKKINIGVLSKLGYPVEVISKISKREKADLAIMGTKGAGGVKEILMGSITADTIKNVPCPVLAVPEKAKLADIKTITLATDLKDINNPGVFDPLNWFLKEFGSDLVILHVKKKTKRFHEKIDTEKQMLNSVGLTPHSFYVIDESDAVTGIEDFIESRDIDLLAMVSRKHNLLERLFKKSVTKKLAMHTRIPLLILKT